MSVRVLFTDLASQQSGALRGKQQIQVANFLDQLKAQGCAALGYRLTGDSPLEHLCVKHVGGQLRVVAAFQSAQLAWILLVAPHDDADPGIDVYTTLYRLIGTSPPSGERTKPSCCDGAGQPPVLGDIVEQLADRAVRLRRTRR